MDETKLRSGITSKGGTGGNGGNDLNEEEVKRLHPIVSCVIYLDDGGSSQAGTLVTDQVGWGGVEWSGDW